MKKFKRIFEKRNIWRTIQRHKPTKIPNQAGPLCKSFFFQSLTLFVHSSFSFFTLRVLKSLALLLVSRVFLQALTMTFLAEWGDRSQLATIVLAAREDVVAVIIAGLLGHFICTGLAVLGGKMIATKISVRNVTIAGGVVFLIFAATAFFMDPNEG